jgi:hypothetical protein
MLTPEEQSELLALARHWDGSYRFQITDGVWTAALVSDPTCVISAESVSELRELVRADHAARRAAAKDPVYLSERMST